MEINRIVDFGENPIFKATVESCIFIGTKVQESIKNNNFFFSEIDSAEQLIENANILDSISTEINQNTLSKNQWVLTSKENLDLIDHLISKGRPLGEFLENNIYCGIKTGRNKIFIIEKDRHDKLIQDDPKSKDIIKKWLVSSDLDNWGINWKEKYIIYAHHGIDIKKYPAIYEYLLKNKKSLASRATIGQHEWYELQQPQTGLHKYFDSPKILYQNVSRYYKFGLDTYGYYPDMNVFFLPTSDLYLLGVLGSSTMRYFAQTTTGAKTGGFLVLKTIYVKQFPIPLASQFVQDDIIKNVSKILDQKEKGKNIEELKRINDHNIYDLFDLSTKQIKLIEASLG